MYMMRNVMSISMCVVCVMCMYVCVCVVKSESDPQVKMPRGDLSYVVTLLALSSDPGQLGRPSLDLL